MIDLKINEMYNPFNKNLSNNITEIKQNMSKESEPD